MTKNDLATKMEWCNFCGYIPKHGLHRWTLHSMSNYHEEPTND